MRRKYFGEQAARPFRPTPVRRRTRPQFFRGCLRRLGQNPGNYRAHRATRRIQKCPRNLPKLVVVTFTHRAADEMQQRTRQRILEEHRSPAIQAAFNRAFFGTIHSFCMKLLTNYGHYLGFPRRSISSRRMMKNSGKHLSSNITHIGRNLSAETRMALFRLAPARQLMELGRNARILLSGKGEIGQCPSVDFAASARGDSASPFERNDGEFKSGAARLGETIFKPDGNSSVGLFAHVTHEILCSVGMMPSHRSAPGWRKPHSVLPLKCNMISAILDRTRPGHLPRSGRTCGRIAATSRSRPVVCAKKTSTLSWTKHRTQIPRNSSVLTEITRPPDATGRLVGDRNRATAARPFLHGRRFPAIDLSRPRRSEQLPSYSSRACPRRFGGRTRILGHVSARSAAAQFCERHFSPTSKRQEWAGEICRAATAS